MSMKKKLFVPVLCAVALSTSACGSNASSEKAETTTAAITETTTVTEASTEETTTIPETKSDDMTPTGGSSGSETNSTTTAVSSTPVQENTAELTTGQKNALSKAADYLNYTAFSYGGLITQLEYEQFSTEDATYAADNCGADWNEQAAIKAQQYLDYSSFSRGSLIDQLKYEGFTQAQAEHGASAVGY